MQSRRNCILACLAVMTAVPAVGAQTRARARDLGVAPGIFPPGVNNAITDVAGVKVGHATIVRGDSIHTGVTAILPHDGNVFFDRVPAAVHIGNAFGKLIGAAQIKELGELETPILLTCTLCVWRAADALVEELLSKPGMEDVPSINPVVGETNDAGLNAIRNRPVAASDVRAAISSASGGRVAEGSVGAGTGTVAFEWKGGIGTSSRVVPRTLGGWTVGVLVQSNFGGVLQVLGAPVGRELGKYSFQNAVSRERGDGSVMIIVATDAPISDRNLERLAARAIMGLGRTGSSASNGSGDFVIAFSTAKEVRRAAANPFLRDTTRKLQATTELPNNDMSALFEGSWRQQKRRSIIRSSWRQG